MGFVLELIDVLKNLEFYKVVYEYQQGLHFRAGKLIETRSRQKDDEAEWLESEIQDKWKYLIPFLSPDAPEGFRRSFYTGLPLSKHRWRKIMPTGLHFYIPFLDTFIVDSQQQRILNLSDISIVTDKGQNLTISCNVRYQIEDLSKACLAVHDYEQSLKDYVISILPKHSVGKSIEFWQNPNNLAKLEKDCEEELRPIITDEWGMRIHKIYINEISTSVGLKLFGSVTKKQQSMPTPTLEQLL